MDFDPITATVHLLSFLNNIFQIHSVHALYLEAVVCLRDL